MRNVLKILKRDLLRLLKTPQALVVVFALMVIPSLYTWYNVVGFWNPYDNTGNLTVCVVNQDAGGSSELTGELNVGERIVDQLHENNQLHWEFTDYDAAMNELKNKEEAARFREEQDKKAASETAAVLSGKVLKITAKAGQGGRLFGSVTTKEVAEELKKQFGADVDKRKIQMADIKAFGTYEAEIRFNFGISAKMSVMVTE